MGFGIRDDCSSLNFKTLLLKELFKVKVEEALIGQVANVERGQLLSITFSCVSLTVLHAGLDLVRDLLQLGIAGTP